jgi:hypothetical protein
MEGRRAKVPGNVALRAVQELFSWAQRDEGWPEGQHYKIGSPYDQGILIPD